MAQPKDLSLTLKSPEAKPPGGGGMAAIQELQAPQPEPEPEPQPEPVKRVMKKTAGGGKGASALRKAGRRGTVASGMYAGTHQGNLAYMVRFLRGFLAVSRCLPRFSLTFALMFSGQAQTHGEVSDNIRI